MLSTVVWLLSPASVWLIIITKSNTSCSMQFNLKDLKTLRNETGLLLAGTEATSFELITANTAPDRVRYNSFLEHIECYFKNTEGNEAQVSSFSKLPTIIVNRKRQGCSFGLCWVTISESLLHVISWSTEMLNVYMFNHGIPQTIIQILQAIQQKEIELLSSAKLPESGQVAVEFQLMEMGVKEGVLTIAFGKEGVQSTLELRNLTADFITLMEAPRLSKEKRKEIKKIFKF